MIIFIMAFFGLTTGFVSGMLYKETQYARKRAKELDSSHD